MAPAPAIRDAYAELAGHSGKADFGLHITLTAEWSNLRWKPLQEEDSIARSDGTMHYTVEELIAASPNLDALMAEIRAQYELLTNLGFTLSYVDEHMLVGRVPGLAERIAVFAEENNLIYDRTLRESGTLGSFPDWDGPGGHPGTELADQLSTMQAGTYLLYGHPVTKDEALGHIHKKGQSPGAMVQERNRQRRMFMDIEIVDYCENVGIELCRYSQL
jgi:hypothetical protein